MVYCISYDLKTPGRDYGSLYESIKASGIWWHQTGSVWVIVTNKSAITVRDELMRYIDQNDKLFVAALRKEWAGVGFNSDEYNWLKSIPDANWESQ